MRGNLGCARLLIICDGATVHARMLGKFRQQEACRRGPVKTGADNGAWTVGDAWPFSGGILREHGLIDIVFADESGRVNRPWRLPSNKRRCGAACGDVSR